MENPGKENEGSHRRSQKQGRHTGRGTQEASQNIKILTKSSEITYARGSPMPEADSRYSKLRTQHMAVPSNLIHNGQAKLRRPQRNTCPEIPKHTRDRSDKAKADARFASSSSLWYAGSNLDKSPAAHTLPKPTLILNARSSLIAISSNSDGSPRLASSCPDPSTLTNRGLPPYEFRMPASNSKESPFTSDCKSMPHDMRKYEDLKAKSQHLLHMIKSTGDAKSAPAKSKMKLREANDTVSGTPEIVRKLQMAPKSCRIQDQNTERKLSKTSESNQELDEMTLQVRRLLKLS